LSASGSPSRRMEQHGVASDVSFLARALCRSAIGHPLPRLEFDRGVPAAADRLCIIVASASPESTGSCSAAPAATGPATVRPRNAPGS
jgi:hypothetical protein